MRCNSSCTTKLGGRRRPPGIMSRSHLCWKRLCGVNNHLHVVWVSTTPKRWPAFDIFWKLGKLVNCCYKYTWAFVVNLFVNSVHWNGHSTSDVPTCTGFPSRCSKIGSVNCDMALPGRLREPLLSTEGLIQYATLDQDNGVSKSYATCLEPSLLSIFRK